MKKNFILSTLALWAFTAQAQVNGLKHAWSLANDNNDTSIKAVSIAENDNVVVFGTYAGTVDLDPSSTGQTIVTALGSWDCFISKFDTDGNHLWSKTIGSDNTENALAIGTDANGNIYLAGWTAGNFDADPGTGVFNLNNQGGVDAFIIKLDLNGNLQWAYGLGGTGDDEAFGIAVKPDGGVTVGGSFSGTVDFNPVAGGDIQTAQNGKDAFVSHFDTFGNYYYTKVINCSGDAAVRGVAHTSVGDLVVVGFFNGTADFDPSAGSTSAITINGGQDAFVLKLDENGNFYTAGKIGGPESDIAYGVDIDFDGNILVVGQFMATADLNPSVGGVFNRTSNGDRDMFVVKLDPSGNFLWAGSMGGSGWDNCTGIKACPTGHILISGDFIGLADLDPTSSVRNFTAEGSYDGCLLYLDSDGNLVQPMILKGTGGATPQYQIGLSSTGRFFVGGDFDLAIDTDPGLAQQVSNTSSFESMFLIALDPCQFPMIEGNATVGGVPCGNCKIYSFVYPGAPGQVWLKVDSTFADANGFFQISLPPDTIVSLQLRPETGGFTSCVPTYPGNTHLWSLADQFETLCGDIINADIDAATFATPAGNCTLRGKVWQLRSGKMLEEDPIPLIDVVVERVPPGSVVGMVQTDAFGEFEFELVETDPSPYRVRVMIPGLPVLTPYMINVNNNDVLFGELDYCVDLDTTSIQPCDPNGIAQHTKGEGKFTLMPNPATNKVLLVFEMTVPQTIVIADAHGRPVLNLDQTAVPSKTIEVDLSTLGQGVYQVVAKTNQGLLSSRLVVIR